MNPSRVHWPCSLLLAGAGLLLAASVEAAGYGPYFEYARANGEMDHFDFDANKYGVGFVVDTNVAKDRVFNYRFALGYQHHEREFDNGVEGEFNGITMNHAFGFGLYRGRALRVWAGPSIRLSADVLHEDTDDLHVVDFSAGGGFQVGLNAHTDDRFSLAISFAYQYLYVGEVMFWEDYDDTDHFNGREHLCTLNVSFLFRSEGDRYERKKARRADR